MVLNLLDQGDKAILSLDNISDKLPKTHQQMTVLSPEEHVQYNDLITDKRRKSFFGGRYSAKKALSALTGKSMPEVEIYNSQFGYPYYKGEYDLSISHCSTLSGAIAFSKSIVAGIDIEDIQLDNSEYISEILTQFEQKHLSISGMSAKTLTGYWSAKEALSKSIRVGLTIPFDVFEISGFKTISDTLKIVEFVNFDRMSVIQVTGNSKVLSVALPGDSVNSVVSKVSNSKIMELI